MKLHRFRNGPLTFSAIEQGDGIPVLMLHGFPDHARTFRWQLPALAAAGYHAIAPVMPGYEPSSQSAQRTYRLSSVAQDVLAMIEQTGHGRVHLIGHDWGAVVSYLVAALAPEKLHSLTTIAIPSPGRLLRQGLWVQPGQLLKSWYIFFFQFRGLADFILESQDWAFLQWLWRRWSPGWQPPAIELEAIKMSFRQPGVKRAALDYYRSLFQLRSFGDTLATLKLLERKVLVPTLALTGDRDGCMDTRLHDKLMRPADFPAGLEVVRITEAGHFVHQEQPQAVNLRILQHLAAAERRTSYSPSPG